MEAHHQYSCDLPARYTLLLRHKANAQNPHRGNRFYRGYTFGSSIS